MAFGINGVNNSHEEIANMSDYPHIRLYQTGRLSSQVPEIEITNPNTWSKPCTTTNNKTLCNRGGFSAACWFYGRDIFDKLDPPRPLGLIETNVGG